MRGQLAAIVLVALGCRVDALEGAEYAGPRNHCESGCPIDSQCVDERCIAETTTYPLTIDATPPLSASYAPGVTFTVTVDDRRGGARDLKLPETATVVATLSTGSAIPLSLRLERVGAVPGIPATAYEAKSIGKSTKTPPLSIPPGDYYVFVSPADDANLALYPPVQLRGDDRRPLVVTFASGPQELQISYAADSFRTIDVELTDAMGKVLTDAREARDIRVIDETTGRLASTLAHTCLTPGNVTNTVKVQVAPEVADHRYTLRVEPAVKPCAATTVPLPTLDFDLQALDVEGRGNKVVVQLPNARTSFVRGIVRQYSPNKTGAPIDGDIILRSVKLADDAKVGHASLRLRLAIDRDGTFRDLILPGTYRADIIPANDIRFASSAYAICIDCTIPSQAAMAKPGERTAEFYVDDTRILTFEVAPRVRVTGSAAGFDGSLFTVGTWDAATSTSGASSTNSGALLITRAQSGLVTIFQADKSSDVRWNVDGALDPGAYDFVVRTHEASGYPWIVRPHLEITPTGKLDLGAMQASAPVVFSGRILDPGGAPVPRATIRARALIADSDPKKPALGAVLVGETRADDGGNYKLVVPSTLNVVKPPAAK